MTLRAFIIGLVAVVAVSLFEPYASFMRGYGYLTLGCFPSGAVVVLVVLTLGVNVAIKCLRRRWALRQAELMLVWCMLIVCSAIPCNGIGRYWYSLIAGPPYLAQRIDVHWEEGDALTQAPPELVLSNDPLSVAARQYYEGAPGGRVPWSIWLRPLVTWTVFLLMMYLAVFFMCGVLRRQWVDLEHLMFPLARVPLDFTEGEGASDGVLPQLLRNRAFVFGLAVAGGFRFMRALPLLFGAEGGMSLTIPFKDVLQDTPLSYTYFENVPFWPWAMGFAFLVPADVSLSVWFFYLFSRAELQAAHWLALPDAAGTWSPLMTWQQAGAHIAFSLGTLYLARRHLLAVLRKALGRGEGLDDAAEPVPYRLAFWGFLAAFGGCVGWCWWLGMRPFVALAIMLLLFCAFLVYARVVAQGGLYVSRTIWAAPALLHGITGAMGGAGAVVGHMQASLLQTGANTMLAPLAMDAFRISAIFKKGRRLLLPVLMLTLVVSIACTSYTVLTVAYRSGAVNFAGQWGQMDVPKTTFDRAHRTITAPSQEAVAHYGPLALGMCATAFLMFMRGRYYWWPVHPIGLLACSGWHPHRLWVPFLFGWATKVGIMKLAGGRMLRQGRYFFIAVIIVEFFTNGLSAIVRSVTGGAVPSF